MWFGVLGPLAVRSGDGSAIIVSGPARRALLAALLSRPGETVPAGELIEDLWGTTPPRTAAKTLQSHIVRLRDDLGRTAGESVLRTEAAGYRLSVTRDDVDAAQFEQLVREAGSVAESSSHLALELFDRALDLWRGVAYAGFENAAFATAERIRLAELRTYARERRTEAAMACGRSAEVVPELERRVRDEPFRERGWAQLVLALYRSGRQAEALDAYRRARELLAAELGIEPGPVLRSLQGQILRQDPLLLDTESNQGRTAEAPSPQVCPYRGLTPYGERDVGWFVGRERLTAMLVARLREQQVLVVTGPSGVGKSSLVRAGLTVALRAGALPGSAAWHIAVTTPSGLARDLEAERRQPATADSTSSLLVLDQAEELFGTTVTTDPLARIERHVADGGRLVVVLRADFYARLAEIRFLAAYAERGTVLVGPMRADELRRVVTEPAQRAGLRVAPELVETIMQEVDGQPEPLPHLSQALVRTWEGRKGSLLTVDAYRAGGALVGALAATAEESYAGLSPQARAAARHLLVRLAARSENSWLRQPWPLADLESSADPGVAEALDALVGARLVLVGRQDVELAHDALFTQWPRLRDWLDERALSAALVAHLDQAARAWRVAGRQGADLYRGPRLQSAIDWRQAHRDEISADNAEFLTASERAADEALTEARARADREARGRRRLSRVAVALALAVVLAVSGGLFAVREQRVARAQAARADAAAVTADARRLAALALTAPDADTADLLAASAYRMQDTPDTRNALLSVLEKTGTARFRMPFTERLLRVAASADGSRLFVMDRTRTIDEVDPDTRRIMASYPARASFLDAVTPDGSTLVVSGAAPGSDGSDFGQVALLQAASGAVRQVLPIRSSGPDPVLTADGRRLLVAEATPSGTGSRRIALVDLTHPATIERELRLPAAPIAMAASPDRVAVQLTDNTLQVWSLTTGRLLASAHHPELAPLALGQSSLALSTSGTRLAVATDGVRMFSTSRLSAEGRPLSAAKDVIFAVFSPDGTKLATTRQNGAVQVFSAIDGQQLGQLAGHSGAALGLAWTGARDDPALYTVGLDSQLVRWSLATLTTLVRPTSSRQELPDIAERAGDTVVGVSPPFQGAPAPDERLYVRSLTSGRSRSWRLGLDDDEVVDQVATTPDGRLALVSTQTTDQKSWLALWDLSSGRRLSRIGLGSAPSNNGLVGVLTADGRTAVAALDAHSVGVFALPAGTLERRIPIHFDGPDAENVAVVPWRVDPGGRVLIAGAPTFAAFPPSASAPGAAPSGSTIQTPNDQRLGLLDIGTGRLVAQARIGVDAATSGSWSPDGRRLAIGTEAGRIALYDADSLRLLADAGVVQSGWVLTLSFSPDGSTLVSGGTDAMDFWSVPDLVREGTPIRLEPDVGTGWWYAWYAPDGTVRGWLPVPDRGRTSMEGGFVFDASPSAWVATACRLSGARLTGEQWSRYTGSEPVPDPCAH